MEVLVDYSNVSPADRGKGALFVVDKIVAALGYAHLAGVSRLSVRLYDGWYQGNALTRRAQQVSTEVGANFPKTYTVSDGVNNKTLITAVELAYSMKVEPTRHILDTFRMRGTPWRLSCALPTAAGCTTSPCELMPTHTFITSNKCPSAACTVQPKNLFARSEQKLVDTMLASDLFFLAVQKTPEAAVVSSDDDMWPPIKTVLDLGMRVIQVHTLPGHSTPAQYTHGPRPSYVEISL